MNINVLNNKKENGYKTIEAACGKKKAIISITEKYGYFTMTIYANSNLSRDGYSRIGKTFYSMEEAFAWYKSPEMKQILVYAINS